MTVESFSHAIQRLLTDQSFKMNAQKLSQKLKNNPINVADVFVKYIEYVIFNNFNINPLSKFRPQHLNRILK